MKLEDVLSIVSESRNLYVCCLGEGNLCIDSMKIQTD